MALTHQFTMICEDVRREDNGKFFIFGMFAGVIGTPQIPFAMAMLTFIHFFQADLPGTHQVKFRLIHLESGRQLAEAHAMVNVVQPGPVMLPLKLPNIKFENYGTYNIVAEIDGSHEPILTSFSVAIMSPPPQPQPPLRR